MPGYTDSVTVFLLKVQRFFFLINMQEKCSWKVVHWWMDKITKIERKYYKN